MSSLELLLHGFSVALTPNNILAACIGVLLGTLAGMLPGLGLSGTIALLIPISFGLDPLTALVIFAGIYYGAAYGGSTTSILLNVPGEGASVVTCIEGYQMSKRGRAGAALSVAAIGSFVAGVLGLVSLVALATMIARAALAFGPQEYLCIAVLALVLLSGITGGSVVRSALMASIGIMIGTVGVDPMTGIERFTFGSDGLLSGISFIVVVMGTYGLAEMLHTAANKNVAINPPRVRFKDLYPTREEARRAAPAIARGSLMGLLIGLIPGPSGTISSFLSYAVEKRFSKGRKEFGHGAIEGVAGPEAANNGADSSTLIPLLSLGIPFNSGAALLLTGFLIHGITPGPGLVANHPDLFWGLVASMFIGNAMLLIINLPLVGLFASMLTVPLAYLMPIVSVFVLMGAYFTGYSLFDVGLVIGFGVAAYVLRATGYHMAPLVIGMFLGPLIEKSFAQSMVLQDGNLLSLFARPLSGTMLTIAIAFLILRLAFAAWSSRRAPASAVPTPEAPAS
jgi:putative tricarboxylic transport membrane protein